MANQKKYPIKYAPCFFEMPFKRISTGEKGWCWPIIIWVLIGIIGLVIFAGRLHYYNSSIDWLTTLYFVGGLGWVPATMCGLSRAYYRMCKKIYPYLDEPEITLAEHYNTTANSIFGYLTAGANVAISVVIWVFMIITVIFNNATFSTEYTTVFKFIYAFYVIVGIIFTCVPCAVIHFFRSLGKLRKFKLKNYALYQGAGEQLQKIHTNCTWLIWAITILLVLLAAAMFKSPYHEALWVWLPAFGFVPFGLFVMNKMLTDSLINTALSHEEAALQEKINRILQNHEIEQENLSLYALLGIQDTLREHAKNESTLISATLLLFTILGGLGSIVAAILALFSNETVIQDILRILNANI